MSEISLEKFRYVLFHQISPELAKEFAIQAEIDVSHMSWMSDLITVKVIQGIMGEEVGQIKYPANWKEAVKERFAPAWFLARWPVRYTVKTAAVLYPDISSPKERHIHVFK